MVSEDVTIEPIGGASAMISSVEFRCMFVLKNLSPKALTVQVGFPLDRESHGPPKAPSNDADEVLSYHFIARDANNTYHVRYEASDPQGKYAHTHCVLSVAYSPDGKALASGSQGETIKLWDVATGKNIATLGNQISWVDSLAFTPDGKVLVSSGNLRNLNNNTIMLWDVKGRRTGSGVFVCPGIRPGGSPAR